MSGCVGWTAAGEAPLLLLLIASGRAAARPYCRNCTNHPLPPSPPAPCPPAGQSAPTVSEAGGHAAVVMGCSSRPQLGDAADRRSAAAAACRACARPPACKLTTDPHGACPAMQSGCPLGRSTAPTVPGGASTERSSGGWNPAPPWPPCLRSDLPPRCFSFACRAELAASLKGRPPAWRAAVPPPARPATGTGAALAPRPVPHPRWQTKRANQHTHNLALVHSPVSLCGRSPSPCVIAGTC